MSASNPKIIKTWGINEAQPLMGHYDDPSISERGNRTLDFKSLCKEYDDYKVDWERKQSNDELFKELFKKYEEIKIDRCISLSIGNINGQTLIPNFDTPNLKAKQKALEPQRGDENGTHHIIRNTGLHQLLVLEKILGILGILGIEEVYVADHVLSNDECSFIKAQLERTVSKCTVSNDKKTCYVNAQRKLKEKRGTTFLYCPGMELEHVWKNVEQNFPRLYLGTQIDEPAEANAYPEQHEDINVHLESFRKATEGESFVELDDMPWAGKPCHLRRLKGNGNGNGEGKSKDEGKGKGKGNGEDKGTSKGKSS